MQEFDTQLRTIDLLPTLWNTCRWHRGENRSCVDLYQRAVDGGLCGIGRLPERGALFVAWPKTSDLGHNRDLQRRVERQRAYPKPGVPVRKSSAPSSCTWARICHIKEEIRDFVGRERT